MHAGLVTRRKQPTYPNAKSEAIETHTIDRKFEAQPSPVRSTAVLPFSIFTNFLGGCDT